MISRCSGLSRQPLGDELGGEPVEQLGVGRARRPACRSCSASGRCPRPKWCCQTRLAITRAVSGFSGDAIQSASTRAAARSSWRRPAASGSPARAAPSTSRKPGSTLSPWAWALPRSRTNVSGATGPGLGHAQGRVAERPCASASRRGAGVPAGSARIRSGPSTRSPLRADQAADVDRRVASRFEAESDRRSKPGPDQATSRPRPSPFWKYSSRIGTRPFGSSTLARSLAGRARGCRRISTTTWPSTVSREPSSESRRKVYAPSWGTISVPSKTKPKASSRVRGARSKRPRAACPRPRA